MPTYIPCKRCGAPNLLSDTTCIGCGVKLRKEDVDTKFLNQRLNNLGEFINKVSSTTPEIELPPDVIPNTVFKAQSRYDIIKYLWFLLNMNKTIKIILTSDGKPNLKDLQGLFRHIFPTKVSTQITDEGLELQLSNVDKTDKTLVLKVYKHGHWKLYVYFVDLVS